MSKEDAWSGTVTKKSRELLDGSNLYRMVTIQKDDGRTDKIHIDRSLWDEINVGDRLVKDAGQDPHRA